MELGEIKAGKEIGRDTKADRYHKFIWQACTNCGRQRWVAIRKGKAIRTLCIECGNKTKVLSEETREKYRQAGRKKKGSRWNEQSKAKLRGEKHYNWKGGRHKTVKGYIEVAIYPNDFFYPMAFHSRVKEHRLIMARHLGRCLLPWEIVHHKNGIKDDNRLENLELLPDATKHYSITVLQNYIKELEEKVGELTKRLDEEEEEEKD